MIPVTINNSWNMIGWEAFPLSIGNKLEFIVYAPIHAKDMSFSKILKKTEQAVIQDIK